MIASLGRDEETGYNLVNDLDILRMDENLRLRMIYGIGILILVVADVVAETRLKQETVEIFEQRTITEIVVEPTHHPLGCRRRTRGFI